METSHTVFPSQDLLSILRGSWVLCHKIPAGQYAFLSSGGAHHKFHVTAGVNPSYSQQRRGCMRRKFDSASDLNTHRALQCAQSRFSCSIELYVGSRGDLNPCSDSPLALEARALTTELSGRSDEGVIRKWMINCFRSVSFNLFFSQEKYAGGVFGLEPRTVYVWRPRGYFAILLSVCAYRLINNLFFFFIHENWHFPPSGIKPVSFSLLAHLSAHSTNEPLISVSNHSR